jgi:putative endonuclease
VLYIGVTNNLERRLQEHKSKTIKGFTYKYNLDKLVYYEYYNDVTEAILREKQLKGWKRSRKIELIENINSDWEDLGEKIYK